MDRYYYNTVAKIFFFVLQFMKFMFNRFHSDRDSIMQILCIKCANVIIDVIDDLIERGDICII